MHDLHKCICHMSVSSVPVHVRYMYAYSLPFDAAGETVALVVHDGLDALLDVEQHLGEKGSSATAGGNSPACARATWPAKVASRISRWSD